MEVDATDIWDESGCAIHGEICPSAVVLMSPRGDMMGGQKSAEGIVVAEHGDEGPNM